MWKERKPWSRAGLDSISREMLIEVENRSKVGLQERDSERVQSRLRREANLHSATTATTKKRFRTGLPALHSGLLAASAISYGGSPTSLPIDQLQQFTVQNHLEFFAGDRTEAGRRHVIPKNRSDSDGVLAVRRKHVLNQHPPSRSEW